MRRRSEEDTIQRSLVQHLKLRATPGVFWYAVPNGGVRSKTTAAIMKGTGTRPGVPDLAFLHEGKAFYLEVKSLTGRATEHQLQAVADINAAGGFATIAYGIDAAVCCLEGWGLLRGRAN
jgi:hypothetical protein